MADIDDPDFQSAVSEKWKELYSDLLEWLKNLARENYEKFFEEYHVRWSNIVPESDFRTIRNLTYAAFLKKSSNLPNTPSDEQAEFVTDLSKDLFLKARA